MKKVLDYIKKYYISFVIVCVCFALDMITKYIATIKLTETTESGTKFLSNTVIDGFWYWTYTRNTGGGWSIFSGQMWFFYIITVIALIGFVFFLSDFDLKKRPLYSIGFSMMVGGTLGNFYERIVHGYVTDFFDFIIFKYDYPIFNVADICLVIGVIMLIVQLLFFSNQVTIFDKYAKNNPLEEKKDDSNEKVEENN